MIDSFQGENRWLSNFWYSPILMPDGFRYPTVEHAYQAHKSAIKEERSPFTIKSDPDQQMTPGQAKRAGRKLTLRGDWEDIKLEIMRRALELKFTIPDLKAMLIDTGDEELIEGNTYGDVFWGVCRGKGENNLGKLLMDVRRRLE